MEDRAVHGLYIMIIVYLLVTVITLNCPDDLDLLLQYRYWDRAFLCPRPNRSSYLSRDSTRLITTVLHHPAASAELNYERSSKHVSKVEYYVSRSRFDPPRKNGLVFGRVQSDFLPLRRPSRRQCTSDLFITTVRLMSTHSTPAEPDDEWSMEDRTVRVLHHTP